MGLAGRLLGLLSSALLLHQLGALSAPPDSSWEAYYVEAPLFETHPEPLPAITTAIQAFHSGFALRHTSNGSTLAWEYDAALGVLDAVVPKPNGSVLSWSNEGVVRRLDTFNTSYWRRASFQGKLANEQAAQVATWIRGYNRSAPAGSTGAGAPDYNPFDVVDPTTAELRVRSQTCNDFSHDVVRHLALLGLSAQPLVPNRKCRTILYSSAPLVSVPDTDPELVRYWSGISTIARQTESAHSILAAALLVDELALRRTAFVRVDGRNLRVALEAPFARWAYEEAANGDAKPGNWSWS